MPMDLGYMDRLLPSDETGVDGMKTLYADHSEQ